jgi:hypothetical protein
MDGIWYRTGIIVAGLRRLVRNFLESFFALPNRFPIFLINLHKIFTSQYITASLFAIFKVIVTAISAHLVGFSG